MGFYYFFARCVQQRGKEVEDAYNRVTSWTMEFKPHEEGSEEMKRVRDNGKTLGSMDCRSRKGQRIAGGAAVEERTELEVAIN